MIFSLTKNIIHRTQISWSAERHWWWIELPHRRKNLDQHEKEFFPLWTPQFFARDSRLYYSLDERHCSNNINISQFNWYLLIPVPTAYSLLVFLIFSYSHTVWKLDMHDLVLLTLTYVSALSLLHYSYLNIGIDHKSTAVKSGSLFPVRRPSLVSFSPLPFCVLSWFVFIAKLWLWVTWGWYEWANTPSRRVI